MSFVSWFRGEGAETMDERLFARTSVIGLALALVLAFASPVLAGHNNGHNGGGKKSQASKKASDKNQAGGKKGQAGNKGNQGGGNSTATGSGNSGGGGNSGTQGKSPSDPDDDGRGPDRSNGGPDKPGGSGGVDKSDQDGNNGCGNDDDFEDDNEGWCGGRGEGQDNGKITICHATGSSTNPYVVITISVNGLNGHDGHEDDIIPAPEGGCPEELVAAGSLVEGNGVVQTPCTLNALMTDEKLCDNPDEVLSAALGNVEVIEDAAAPEAQDTVLGTTLTAEVETEEAGTAARAAEVLGGMLPLTGPGVIKFLVVAAALVLAGLFLARRRKTA